MNRQTRMREPGDGQSRGGGGQGRGEGGSGGMGAQHGASRGGHLRRYGGVGMLLRHGSHFGLSDDQSQRLEALRAQFEMEKVDLEACMKKSKIKMRHMMRDLDSGEGDVMSAIDEVAGCESDMRKMRFRHLQQARAVLDDGQRSKLKGFRLAMQQEHVDAAHGQRAQMMGGGQRG